MTWAAAPQGDANAGARGQVVERASLLPQLRDEFDGTELTRRCCEHAEGQKAS